jgi:hypothetical protein
MWVLCRCGDWWCLLHSKHVHDCDCPPVHLMEEDPYV